MAQESEWNELAYDNIATTFSLSTDNVATSDELSAPPVYENGKDTLYAKNHRAKKITTISLITLSATAALAAGGSVITNAFVGDPPSISSDGVVSLVSGTDVLHYEFEVTNKRHYKTVLKVYVDKTETFTLDITEPGPYIGETGHLGFGVSGTFKAVFGNGLDYKQQIWAGSFAIPPEGE